MKRKAMRTSVRILAASAILAGVTSVVNADIYYYNHAGSLTSQDWVGAGIWTPDAGNTSGGTFPNAVGDRAIFNSLATANNPAQTANHIVSLNTTATLTDKTVGEINFNLDSGTAFRNEIRAGQGGTLIFDATGAGPAKISESNSATAMGLSTITCPMLLNDPLEVTVNNTSNRADGLALRLQGNISGAGGITKHGPTNSNLTMVPLAGNSYTYTGPTVLGNAGDGTGGRTQMSPAGSPTLSTSFTIEGNAQLEPTATGSYQLGAGTLFLNSDGTGNTGAFGVNAGSIRQSRDTNGFQVTITNSSVVLQAPLNIIHVQTGGGSGGDPSNGFIKFTGVISGGSTNVLNFTPTGHDNNTGTYVMENTNTFSGGIELKGGRLSPGDFITDGGVFNSATTTTHPNATLGTGNVHVNATSVFVNSASFSRLTIQSGVLNAISNSATLWLDGNNDNGDRRAFAELGDSVAEVVKALKLGLAGTTQLGGVTYGSSTSPAMFQDNTYFTGNGMIQVGALGDCNSDGTVDGGDYVVWRKSYSGNTALYDLWRANYGNTAPGSGSGSGLSSGSVPEPSTFGLVGLVGSIFAATRRRRFASRQ
jgi:hypothetical protein